MRQAIKRFFLRRRSCASRGIQRVHDEAKGALRRVWCTRAATHGNGGAAGGRASGCADTSAGRVDDVDVGWDADTAARLISAARCRRRRGARGRLRPTRPPSWAPPAWGGPRRALPATSSFPSPPFDAPAYSPAALGCTPRSPRSACCLAGARAVGGLALGRGGGAALRLLGGKGLPPCPCFPPLVFPPHSVGAPPATVPLRRAVVRLCVCSFRRPPAVGGGTHAPTTVRRTGRLLLLFHRVPPPSVGAGGSGAGAMAQDGEAHGGGAPLGVGAGGGEGVLPRTGCAAAAVPVEAAQRGPGGVPTKR